MEYPEAVTVTGESGRGRLPEVAEYKVRAFDILLISSSRTLSLAEPAYPWNERKAIVPRMARMVITTISSTRVKAEDLRINGGKEVKNACLTIYTKHILLQFRYLSNFCNYSLTISFNF
jgi:hypothetical protein